LPNLNFQSFDRNSVGYKIISMPYCTAIHQPYLWKFNSLYTKYHYF
jgi:hypothetical protein